MRLILALLAMSASTSAMAVPFSFNGVFSNTAPVTTASAPGAAFAISFDLIASNGTERPYPKLVLGSNPAIFLSSIFTISNAADGTDKFDWLVNGPNPAFTLSFTLPHVYDVATDTVIRTGSFTPTSLLATFTDIVGTTTTEVLNPQVTLGAPVVPAPEPASIMLALFGLALGGAAFRARRATSIS